ncbi:hypothetical protein D3C76_1283870 [compost metagenome]
MNFHKTGYFIDNPKASVEALSVYLRGLFLLQTIAVNAFWSRSARRAGRWLDLNNGNEINTYSNKQDGYEESCYIHHFFYCFTFIFLFRCV